MVISQNYFLPYQFLEKKIAFFSSKEDLIGLLKKDTYFSSKEDLSFSSLPPFQSNGNGLSSKWRSSRRSLSGSREEMYESMEAQSERLLDEREAELKKRLQNFEDGNTK